LLPDDFAAALARHTFTNGREDQPLANRLYSQEFTQRFANATGLVYHNLGWGDAELLAVSKVLAFCNRLESLNLNGNRFVDLSPLSEQLRCTGFLPCLKRLLLADGATQLSSASCVKQLIEVCEARAVELHLLPCVV